MRAQSEKKSERARRNAVCRRILSFLFSSLLSLSFSLSLTHTIRRTLLSTAVELRAISLHSRLSPLSPFLPLCLSLPLPCRVSCHAKHASSENAPRRDTPHHYLPGEILARSLMKRKSRGSRPHLRSFVTYSPESSSRARAREHGFIVPDAPRYIAFNYLADPISHQSSSFSVARCLREEHLN